MRLGQGDDFYRHNGAGEMLVYTAADFEDFLEPRPEMAATMDDELRQVVTFLAQNNWPFRLHATYNETIERALNVSATAIDAGAISTVDPNRIPRGLGCARRVSQGQIYKASSGEWRQ